LSSITTSSNSRSSDFPGRAEKVGHPPDSNDFNTPFLFRFAPGKVAFARLIRSYDFYGFKNEFQPLADTYLTRCRCSGIHPTQMKNANHEQMKNRILQSASDPGIKFLNKIAF
jgi:hypothetical protein